MVGVTNEQQRVVLLLGGRKRDVMLSCKEAYKLVEQLRLRAVLAERDAPVFFKGEVWDCNVESYDGFVAMRFYGPEIGYPEKVPIPPDAARKLADTVEFKAQQAEYKMRFVFEC